MLSYKGFLPIPGLNTVQTALEHCSNAVETKERKRKESEGESEVKGRDEDVRFVRTGPCDLNEDATTVQPWFNHG